MLVDETFPVCLRVALAQVIAVVRRKKDIESRSLTGIEPACTQRHILRFPSGRRACRIPTL